jgi:hypothetical protein
MKEYKIKINAELLRSQLNQRKELSIIDNYNISNVGMPDPKKINDDFFKKYLSENQLNENLVIGGNQNSDTVTAQSQTTIRFGGYYYVGDFITREISSAFQQYGKGLIIVDNDSWGGDPFGRVPIYNAIRLIYGSSGNYGKYTAIDPALQCFVDCCSVGKRGAQFGKMWDASYPYGSPVLTNKNFTTGTYRYGNYSNYDGLFGYYEDVLTAFGPNNPASVYYTTLDLSQNFELLNSCGLIQMGITYNYMDYLKRSGGDCLCNLFTFPEPDFWDELVQWVYNGGIISITTRYPSCFDNWQYNSSNGFSEPECPAAIHLNGYINNFLSLFGGMINIGNPSYLINRAYTSHIRSAYYTPNYLITTLGSNIDYYYRYKSEGYLNYFTRAPLPTNPNMGDFKYIGYLAKINYTELGDNFLFTGLYNGQPYGTQGIDKFGNVNPNQSQRVIVAYGNAASRVLNLSGNAIPMKYADLYDNITYIGQIPYGE